MLIIIDSYSVFALYLIWLGIKDVHEFFLFTVITTNSHTNENGQPNLPITTKRLSTIHGIFQ